MTVEPNPPVIRARDLRFSYPTDDGTSGFCLHLDELSLNAGDRLAVFGPSGCGKSTLLDLIAGIRVADSGQLEVAGEQPARLSEAQRRAHRIRRMGFVFQDFPLVDYLSSLDNVLLPFRLTSALQLNDQARRKAQKLLDELGLGALADRRPARLSQGERQRVAIARALVTDPVLLLADEPTAGLDPQRCQGVIDLLEDLCLKRSLALVLVTHDSAVLDRFPQRLDLTPQPMSVEA